jgi:hypothetical protein
MTHLTIGLLQKAVLAAAALLFPAPCESVSAKLALSPEVRIIANMSKTDSLLFSFISISSRFPNKKTNNPSHVL